MMIKKQHNYERGAVSLFIVLFTALLVTIVTISFVQLMLRDQQQATTSDLSQSAYDSAQAGIEDAKRALLLNQACEQGTSGPGVNCVTVQAAVASNSCKSVSVALNIPLTNNETLIQQNASDKKLDQAYTCVKILDTPDYIGTLQANDSQIVPLVSSAPFDTIELSWFTSGDFSSPSGSQDLAFPSSGSGIELPSVNAPNWPTNAPALLRTQLIQTSDNFSLTDFDDTVGGKSDAHTLFLYPSKAGSNSKSFGIDVRRSGVASPQLVKCENDLNTALYGCTTTISVPEPINGTVGTRTASLRLSALYNKSTFKVRLKNGAAYVPFSGAQSEVDSTGRANDVFRRVKARVTLGGNFPYPQAAIDIERDLCKNFSITDNPADYGVNISGVCTPTP